MSLFSTCNHDRIAKGLGEWLPHEEPHKSSCLLERGFSLSCGAREHEEFDPCCQGLCQQLCRALDAEDVQGQASQCPSEVGTAPGKEMKETNLSGRRVFRCCWAALFMSYCVVFSAAELTGVTWERKNSGCFFWTGNPTQRDWRCWRAGGAFPPSWEGTEGTAGLGDTTLPPGVPSSREDCGAQARGRCARCVRTPRWGPVEARRC